MKTGDPPSTIFKMLDFASFQQTLDAEMKRLKSAALGAKPKQAEPLSEEDEEKLWQAKVIGVHSSQALLNTIIYMNGVYFALRSGAEHRQLRHKPCHIQVMDVEGDRPYLEHVSKNHPGGLIKAGRYPGVPYKPFPSSNCGYTSLSCWGG